MKGNSKGVEENLSSEQHSAVIAYAEAKQKDTTKVSWSEVAADGAEKWISKGDAQMK